MVLFLLQMSKHVGPVPTANVYTCFGPVTTTNCTCWFCYYCISLHVLVLFLPSRAGPVSTTNVCTCWSGSYCKFPNVLALFQLQMSTSIGPVPITNEYMCWPCSNCKCLHVLVLFLLQMSTHVGPVPTANVYTCCSCSCGKCLHILFLFLRQMSTRCFSLVPTANVLIFYSKQLNFKDTAKYCITVTPSAWCSIIYLLDFIIGNFKPLFLNLKILKLYFIMAPSAVLRIYHTGWTLPIICKKKKKQNIIIENM